MALTMPASAQMLTKSWGHIEFQTVWESKSDFNTGAQTLRSGGSADNQNLTYKVMYERFRLYIQHGDPKTVRAVIGFEGDSSNWGEPKNTNANNISSGGQMGVYGTDQVQLEIKHAYLEFVIPNTPLTATIGMQGFVLGRGRPLFINNDAPGIRLTAKFAPHEVSVGWWRENDGASSSSAASRTTWEVRENYFFEYELKQKAFNFYAWGNYQNDNRGFIHDMPYWLGVGGGAKPGNFSISGQLVYVGGTKENYTGALVKQDYAAYAAEVLGEYQIGPGLSAGAELFYATGNDANDTQKIKTYPVATSSEARSGFGNDRTVIFWMASGVIGYQHNIQSDYGGFWYGRLFGTYSPTKWLQLIANYLYIGDTSTGNPANVGTGGNINSPTGARQVKDEDFVGHEINVIAKLNIYPGFTYTMGLATFLPGDMYASYTGTTKTKSPEQAWAFNTRLIYNF
jgi:hypothetical protein